MEKRLGIVPGPFSESASREEQLIDLGKRVAQAVMIYGSLSPTDRANLLDTMHELVDFLSQMVLFLSKLSAAAADDLERCGVLSDKYQRPEEQLREARAASKILAFRELFRGYENAANDKKGFDAELALVTVPGNVFVIGCDRAGRVVWRRMTESADQLTATG